MYPDVHWTLSPVTIPSLSFCAGLKTSVTRHPTSRATRRLPYTPISRQKHEDELVLLINKCESGVVSRYVHERLKPGAASPSASSSKNGFEHVVIGGGSIVTPLHQALATRRTARVSRCSAGTREVA
ncbi:hypothetical protein V8E53_012130 [Lactarius tabidus]